MHTTPVTKYFLYARKSSEAEDRQVASIDSQIEEFKRIAAKEGISIVEVLSESRSAKAPGRPVFSYMLKQIEKGKAQGILCWKLDRLARNPIDGGQIIWLLQQGVIKHILTYEKSYWPSDNVLMMSVEFGMANQFIRDLSLNVKRGLNKKVNDGVMPSVAPIGYLNTPDRERGYKVIIEDPLRFPLIRKMWDLMLTGHYTPPKILEIANKEWGFTTVKRRKVGGIPLARSTIYKIFSSPFYYGYFEWPKGSDAWYKGNHKPMVTEDEFNKVQSLLGKKGKLAKRSKTFAFTGLIKCGDCGCFVTAEDKIQTVCTSCKTKFASEGKDSCPKCGRLIAKMRNPIQRHYTYYHCTHRKPQKTCKQPSIEIKTMVIQIDECLQQIEFNERYLNAALTYLKSTHEKDEEFQKSKTIALQKSYDITCDKLEKLLDLRINNVIDDFEFEKKRKQLQDEKEKLADELTCFGKGFDESQKFIEETLQFAGYARLWFKDAQKKNDQIAQRKILSRIGSNLILKDKKLFIDKEKPFKCIESVLKLIPQATRRFEPEKKTCAASSKESFEDVDSRWLATVDEIRTYDKWQLSKNNFTEIDEIQQ